MLIVTIKALSPIILVRKKFDCYVMHMLLKHKIQTYQEKKLAFCQNTKKYLYIDDKIRLQVPTFNQLDLLVDSHMFFAHSRQLIHDIPCRIQKSDSKYYYQKKSYTRLIQFYNSRSISTSKLECRFVKRVNSTCKTQ